MEFIETLYIYWGCWVFGGVLPQESVKKHYIQFAVNFNTIYFLKIDVVKNNTINHHKMITFWTNLSQFYEFIVLSKQHFSSENTITVYNEIIENHQNFQDNLTNNLLTEVTVLFIACIILKLCNNVFILFIVIADNNDKRGTPWLPNAGQY